MFIRIGFETVIEARSATPLILALSPHPSYPGRLIGSPGIVAEPEVPLEEYLDPFGNRRVRLVAPAGCLTLRSDCIAEDAGVPDIFNWNARQHDIMDLPTETLPYLTASRYCESDELGDRAWELFGNTPPGWARVQAICNWVHNHLTFGYGFGRPTKTAADAMREKTGVCRDFAHLALTLCRAVNIPARYASGYLGDIGVAPTGYDDFCAWFEAFLDGRWYVFDARYNTPRIGRITMVYGRDAADVPMITSFGSYDLKLLRVWTHELPDAEEEALHGLLRTPPVAAPLVLAPAVAAVPGQRQC